MIQRAVGNHGNVPVYFASPSSKHNCHMSLLRTVWIWYIRTTGQFITLCVYACICIYTYVFVYIHTSCVHAVLYIYTYKHTCIHTYRYIYIYIYIIIHMYIYIYMHTHTYTYIRTYIYAHVYAGRWSACARTQLCIDQAAVGRRRHVRALLFPSRAKSS
jgi:hypothetical protein